MEESVKQVKNLTYYPVKGEFTGDYTMRVGCERLRRRTSSSSQVPAPRYPPIKGLDKVELPHIAGMSGT